MVLGSWGRTVTSAALSALLACGTAGAIVLTGQPAAAQSSYESPYGFDRTWNAALRMVRVDLGLKITEKDDQNGYLMFEYHSSESGKKGSSGSMEFVRPPEPDAPVRVVIQLPQMPRYHEQVMLDSLVRKMHAEYGDPPQPKPRPPAAPPAPPPKTETDAGAPSTDGG
jgi:hypothetical protein